MNFQSNQKILIKVYEIISGEYTLGFGVFNVIHPGHIRYLENARSYGLKLIIAVSEYSDGKDGQNTESIYSVQQRAESIAVLRIVDHVVIVRKNGLSDLVKKINPKYLVLGKEYEDNKSPDIRDAINFIKGVNGYVKFHAGEIHYANTGLYENDISDVSNERKIQFQEIQEQERLVL
jgi:cytidyltransferase-like protein